MVFTYRNITVSGSRADTEGVSKFIQEAKLFLEAAGWQTVSNRTTQAGNASSTLTHKLVLSSNGEAGQYPTFYMTLFSGTGAAVASNTMPAIMHTAYDTGINDVPTSGVSSSPSNGQDTVTVLNTPSESNFEVWMSGDSEAVVFVTRQTSTYDSMMIGRANSFMSVSDNSFPLYVNAAAASAIIIANTSVHSVGGNPPQAFIAANDASADSVTYNSANQPYDLDAATSIYLAAPILLTYRDAAPIRKGAVGTLRNGWVTIGTAGGVLAEGRLTASGSFGVQTYRAFPLFAEALLIRES